MTIPISIFYEILEPSLGHKAITLIYCIVYKGQFLQESVVQNLKLISEQLIYQLGNISEQKFCLNQ